MSRLIIREAVAGENYTLDFRGKIDEYVHFGDLKLDQKTKIIFNLLKVTNVNSSGIREWVKLMKQIDSSTYLTILNCHSMIIDQVNMIQGFFPTQAFIKSFFIPYFCEQCNEITTTLVKRDNKTSKIVDIEENVRCFHCKGKAEIDVIKDQYFRFLEKY